MMLDKKTTGEPKATVFAVSMPAEPTVPKEIRSKQDSKQPWEMRSETSHLEESEIAERQAQGTVSIGQGRDDMRYSVA